MHRRNTTLGAIELDAVFDEGVVEHQLHEEKFRS